MRLFGRQSNANLGVFGIPPGRPFGLRSFVLNGAVATSGRFVVPVEVPFGTVFKVILTAQGGTGGSNGTAPFGTGGGAGAGATAICFMTLPPGSWYDIAALNGAATFGVLGNPNFYIACSQGTGGNAGSSDQGGTGGAGGAVANYPGGPSDLAITGGSGNSGQNAEGRGADIGQLDGLRARGGASYWGGPGAPGAGGDGGTGGSGAGQAGTPGICYIEWVGP